MGRRGHDRTGSTRRAPWGALTLGWPLGLGLCVLACLVPGRLSAEEPRITNWNAAAELLYRAARTGEVETLDATIRRLGAPTLEVIHNAVGLHWILHPEEVVPPREVLNGLRRFAATNTADKDHFGLVKVLMRWTSMDEEAWAREARRARRAAEFERLVRARLDEVLLAIYADDADMREPPGSCLFLWRCHRFACTSLDRRGRRAEARAIQRRLAEEAARVRWVKPALRAYDAALRLAVAERSPNLVREIAVAYATHAGSTGLEWAVRDAGLAAGRALLDWGHAKDAVPLLVRAVELAGRQGETRKEILGLRILQRAQRALYAYTDALATSERLRTRAAAAGDHGSVIFALGKEAMYLSTLRRYSASRVKHEEALEVTKDARWAAERVGFLIGLAELLAYMGDAPGALTAAKEAVSVSATVNKRALGLRAEQTHVTALLAAERYDEAELAIHDLLARLDPGGDVEARTHLLLHLTQRAQQREAWHEATRHLHAVYENELRGPATDDHRLGKLAKSVGLIYSGRFAESAAILRPTLETMPKEHNLRASFLAFLGQAYVGQKAWEDAVPVLEEALEHASAELQGLASRDTSGMQPRIGGLADLGVRAMLQRASQDPAAHQAHMAKAFWFLESGRALQLVHERKARGDRGAAIPTALRDEESASRRALGKAQRRRLATLAARRPASEVKAAVETLEAAWVRRDAAVRAIERVSRRGAFLLRPRPVALEAWQAQLRAGEAYVAWSGLLDEFMTVFVVTKDAAEARELPRTETLQEALDLFVTSLQTTGASSEATQRAREQVHAGLVAPTLALLGDATHLRISLPSDLAGLPVTALPLADGTPWIDRYAVSIVPSATTCTLGDGDAPPSFEGLLAVADPVSTPLLPRLPGTRREAVALGTRFEPGAQTVLVGEAATVGAVVEALEARPWQVVHMGCHGVFNPRLPERSGLVMSGPEVLSAHLIQSRRIRADLAVLSACDTGRGRGLAGEGALGLPRAFLWAGVRHVVASAWRVPDEATAHFFERFYAALLGDGLPPAAALRRAQREAAASKSDPDAGASVWAAFSLWSAE